MATRRQVIVLWQIAIFAFLLVIWQWGFEWSKAVLPRAYVPKILDPYFVAKPSLIWQSFLRLSCLNDPSDFLVCFRNADNNLWIATLVTLKNTWWGFLFGSAAGIVVGLLLGRSDVLARIFGPFILAFNSIPRIALVPLIILMFGLGDVSKVVTAALVVFFIVFFNTFEGTRAVDRDQIAAARLLGASELTILRTVVIPSALAWVFASLLPAVSFALVGVIVGEFIGAERGLGKLIIEAEARANASEMMVAIFIMMIVGTMLALLVQYLQSYLLRWQPQFERSA
ncbi:MULTISPECIES: ABC transporter permease [Bradyrhizobium]|uniref:ABC transporter permease n=3 Tax=Bradyrhizobium TaxID=374 RepID=A0A410VI80_9BRAD|nr:MULTISPECIES: ABC transporter permease [Bradyrhizobium]MCG2628286.1 ABC transporter permease [Bradyrhizobium zhengyangense]MCG2643405.1 ABC transporter permease [Bradyrhizobium zhengyangense]MCG2670280.1 ABC transporter permease [Bradyrhizobium zhengyangense]MDN4985985.1 ABC transporter permease [Bradyrhizobium sp. WYCCWR 13022]MDN5002635.1 ABC transporter permease [Bradyrhizobium sp. WYCCWR 12677]